MRLYKIIPSAIKGDPERLEDTGETFKSVRIFTKHLKTHGHKYSGDRWKLISERMEPRAIAVTEKKQYDIAFG